MRFPNPYHAFAVMIVIGQSVPTYAYADAAKIQTAGPIIHLADNLDEEASLG